MFFKAYESCSDIDNNELDYNENENDSDNGDENCKNKFLNYTFNWY